MGVKGLLQSFSNLSGNKKKKQYNIVNFSGQTIAIDGSVLLFRAAYTCADILVENIDSMGADCHSNIQAERKYTSYVINFCENLINHANIKGIVIVFDSPNRLPLKTSESEAREKRRKEYLEEARRLKGLGNHNEAYKKYTAAIKVTQRMAQVTTQSITAKYGNSKLSRVKTIFAPFEADAQLVALVQENQADAVMTEDSDVVLYSVAANISFPIIYKFDKYTGECNVLNMNWLINDINITGDNHTRNTALAILLGSSNDQFASALRLISAREQREPGSGRRLFIQACVLSGCDYVPNLKGVGPAKAFKLIKENASRSSESRFKHILRTLQGNSSSSRECRTINNQEGESTLVLNPSLMNEDDWIEYENRLSKAEAAFYYHHVKIGNKIVSLQEMFRSSVSNDNVNNFHPCVDKFGDDLSFLGHTVIEHKPIFDASQNFSAHSSSVDCSKDESKSLDKFTCSSNLFEKFSFSTNQSKLNHSRRVTLEASDSDLPPLYVSDTPQTLHKSQRVLEEKKENILKLSDSNRNISDDDSDCQAIDSPIILGLKKTCGMNACSTSKFFTISSSKGVNKENKAIFSSAHYRSGSDVPRKSNILAGFAKQQKLYSQSHPVQKSFSGEKRKVSQQSKRMKRIHESKQTLTMKDFCQPLTYK